MSAPAVTKRRVPRWRTAGSLFIIRFQESLTSWCRSVYSHQLLNWRVSGCSVKRHQLQAMFTGIQRTRAQWRCVLLFQYCYDFNRTSSLLMRSPPQHGSGKSPHRCQMWWACLCRQGAHQPRPTGQNFWQTLAIYGPMSLCATYTCKHFKKMRCTSLQVNRKQASLLMTPRLNQTHRTKGAHCHDFQLSYKGNRGNRRRRLLLQGACQRTCRNGVKVKNIRQVVSARRAQA